MWKNVKTIGTIVICLLVFWHLWESLCRVNGWNALGRPLWFACLSLILLLVVGSPIAWVVYRKYQRDMNRLFTAEEREELNQISQTHSKASGAFGRKAGNFLGAVGILCGFLYVFCDLPLLLAFLPMGIVALVWLLFSLLYGMREGRKMKQYMDVLKSAAEKDGQGEDAL